ncbi:MAG: alpha/beta fold hydrolase [Oceanospirillaceae bacterium]
MNNQKFTFAGHNGDLLAAKLILPNNPTKVGAVFAHCFTCSKDILAARTICETLAQNGVAVLSFDFTGLGHSAGEFANTHFSSNVEDLLLACQQMERLGYPVQLLIGHSLGGAAVISAAGRKAIDSLKAVAVIGAPFEPDHVLDNFSVQLDEIAQEGTAKVLLAGREFRINQSFVEDISGTRLESRLAAMKCALLILHSPIDSQVNVSNAALLFQHAKHPKSYVSLDSADHLLTNIDDAKYAANVISSWAQRYLVKSEDVEVKRLDAPISEDIVRVSEVALASYKQYIDTQNQHIFADEPASIGGTDEGLTPYQLLGAALGACTNMTIRMYAKRKQIALDSVSVDVSHNKIHANDCQSCDTKVGKLDQFQRDISLKGTLTAEQRMSLLKIADKCPVHRTLEGVAEILTVERPEDS